MEKQFITESLLLEKIAQRENAAVDEILDIVPNAVESHIRACDESFVEFCICNAQRPLEGLEEPF